MPSESDAMSIKIFERILHKVVDKISEIQIRHKSNIQIGEVIKIRGRPIIDIRENATLTIKNNVTLHSRNQGYHANMHSSVKLMADGKNAKIEIGENSRLNGCCIHAKASIIIGKNCLIAANVQIIDSNGHAASFEAPENRIHTSGEAKPIKINDNVWIGLNSIILPGVTIGSGAIIGANTVVTKDVPPMVTLIGNPGRISKKSAHQSPNTSQQT